MAEGNPFFTNKALRSLLASNDVFYADVRRDRKPVGELRLPPQARHLPGP